MAKLGCCATIILGLSLILGLVFKYTKVFNKFLVLISTLVKSTTITGFLIFVIVISVFCLVVSLFGLIGSCCTNRFFLICYEIVIVLLFLSQAIALMVLLFSSSKIEKEFKNGLNNTVNDINDNKSYQSQCALMESLSGVFQCCGLNGPKDFTNPSDVYSCCDKKHNSTLGCGDKIVKDIKQNYVGFIVIPNSLILGIELFAVITVPFLIGRIGRGNSY